MEEWVAPVDEASELDRDLGGRVLGVVSRGGQMGLKNALVGVEKGLIVMKCMS